jgi:hypothetical protein
MVLQPKVTKRNLEQNLFLYTFVTHFGFGSSLFVLPLLGDLFNGAYQGFVLFY